MIELIWAMDQDRLVGKGNRLPWHYKEDLCHFKKCTEGKTVLMGLQTYYSLKGYYKTKPLPFGTIYVASLEDVEIDGVTIVKDVVEFVKNYKDDLKVIGGKTIYELTLPYADILNVTIIQASHEGDVYFPDNWNRGFAIHSRRISGILHFMRYVRCPIQSVVISQEIRKFESI